MKLTVVDAILSKTTGAEGRSHGIGRLIRDIVVGYLSRFDLPMPDIDESIVDGTVFLAFSKCDAERRQVVVGIGRELVMCQCMESFEGQRIGFSQGVDTNIPEAIERTVKDFARAFMADGMEYLATEYNEPWPPKKEAASQCER